MSIDFPVDAITVTWIRIIFWSESQRKRDKEQKCNGERKKTNYKALKLVAIGFHVTYCAIDGSHCYFDIGLIHFHVLWMWLTSCQTHCYFTECVILPNWHRPKSNGCITISLIETVNAAKVGTLQRWISNFYRNTDKRSCWSKGAKRKEQNICSMK